jgi:hypothetical protein
MEILSRVKYIRRNPGEMPFYESALSFDKEVTHKSFGALMAGLERPGTRIISVTQRGVELTLENYRTLQRDRNITVLCVPVPIPVHIPAPIPVPGVQIRRRHMCGG